MSVQAIVWVLEDAPDLPAHLVAPLLGLANHADQDGRGAFPSTDTVSWYTRKGRDATRRDLDSLVELGLIAPGDQRMVLHIPADRRPVVYDLAMHRTRSARPERRPSGRPRKQQVSDVDTGPEIGGVHTPPRFPPENRGGPHAQSGGSTDPPNRP